MAIIDTPDGGATYGEERSALAQFTADIATICKAWLGNGESTVYLHNNHLGATELVTDASGRPIWHATYGPFGKHMQAGALGIDLQHPARLGRPGLALRTY